LLLSINKLNPHPCISSLNYEHYMTYMGSTCVGFFKSIVSLNCLSIKVCILLLIMLTYINSTVMKNNILFLCMYQNNQAYKTPHREREPIKRDTHCVYGGHPHIFQRSCYFTYPVICCNFFLSFVSIRLALYSKNSVLHAVNPHTGMSQWLILVSPDAKTITIKKCKLILGFL